MSSIFREFRSAPTLFHCTGRAFDRADQAGVFDGLRIELVDGMILDDTPISDACVQAIQLSTNALLATFPETAFTVSVRCPMRLGESRVLPDFVVVAGTPRKVVEHPTTALLVVEVSDTTLKFDRTDKAELYALHGIPDYWIVNIKSRCVEVRRKPTGAGIGDPQYSELRLYSADESIAPLAAPNASVKVVDLLP